jgi:hypothetical protein
MLPLLLPCQNRRTSCPHPQAASAAGRAADLTVLPVEFGGNLIQRFWNAFGDAGSQSVDRRIVNGDYGNPVVFCGLH